MIDWKEDTTSKSFLKCIFPQYAKIHIEDNVADFALEKCYACGIDNILKNGSTSIIDVQKFAGKKLRRFYKVMVKYKDYLEIQDVYDDYILDVKYSVKYPPEMERELLEISKLEYEYTGSCTIEFFADKVGKELEGMADKHFRKFKQMVRNGEFSK